MILDSTELRIKEQFGKNGFYSPEFEYKPRENNGKNYIQFIYKADHRYDFEWRWHKNPTGNDFKTNSAGRPFTTFQPSFMPFKNEEEVFIYGEVQFDAWLKKLRTELIAKQKLAYIDNPFNFHLSEEEMDKPFNEFEKELYLNGINNFIFNIQNSTIQEGVKVSLLNFADTSKQELNFINVNELQTRTKRSFLKWMMLGFVGIIGLTASNCYTYVQDKTMDELWNNEKYQKDRTQFIHAVSSAFHFVSKSPLTDDSVEFNLPPKSEIRGPDYYYVNHKNIKSIEEGKLIKEVKMIDTNNTKNLKDEE